MCACVFERDRVTVCVYVCLTQYVLQVSLSTLGASLDWQEVPASVFTVRPRQVGDQDQLTNN